MYHLIVNHNGRGTHNTITHNDFRVGFLTDIRRNTSLIGNALDQISRLSTLGTTASQYFNLFHRFQCRP